MLIKKMMCKAGDRGLRPTFSRLFAGATFGFMTGLPTAILCSPAMRGEYPHVAFWGLVLAAPAAFLGYCFGLVVDRFTCNLRLPLMSRPASLLSSIAVYSIVVIIYGTGMLRPPL